MKKKKKKKRMKPFYFFHWNFMSGPFKLLTRKWAISLWTKLFFKTECAFYISSRLSFGWPQTYLTQVFKEYLEYSTFTSNGRWWRREREKQQANLFLSFFLSHAQTQNAHTGENAGPISSVRFLPPHLVLTKLCLIIATGGWERRQENEKKTKKTQKK